jgi:hypothetical protein
MLLMLFVVVVCISLPQKGAPSHISERCKVETLLSVHSIEYALGLKCEPCRNSRCCDNGMLCKDVLNRSVGENVVRQLRQSLWYPDADSALCSPNLRRSRLVTALTEMRQISEDGSFVMCFELNKKPVCKYFYKVC